MAPRSGQGERRTIGLFSLTIGAVLLVLILARGQQAAREGNQELRNDTYWVLVSPLVFSGFGLYLLRTPGRGTGRREAGRAVRPPTELQRSVSSAQLEAQQSQQRLEGATAEAEQRLGEARRELEALRAAAAAGEQRLQQAAATSQERIAALERQLEGMQQARNRAEADLQSLLEQRSSAEDRSPQQALALRQRLDSLASDLEQRLAETRHSQAEALGAQRRQLEQLQQQLSASEAAAAAARDRAAAAVAGLEGRLGTMAGRLQELDQERQQLHGALQTLQQEGGGAAQAALDAAAAGRAELNQLLSQLHQQQSDLEHQLDRVLREESSRLAEARQQLEGTLNQLEQGRAQQAAAGLAASERLVAMEQQIQEAQQAGQRGGDQVTAALADLERARAQLHSGLEASREQVERAAGRVSEQMGQAREDAARALKLSQEAMELLERFELGVGATGSRQASAAAGAGEAFQAGYREACEEIGVLPGSDWAVVRATWRRQLKLWHPDQGGDPQRWMRRNAAYQLLTAWYDFDSAS